MDDASKGQNNNGLEPRQQLYHCCGQSRPPYELYETGINEVGRSCIKSILAFLKNRGGGEVVAFVAILVLFGIAREFIRSRKDGFDSFALVGCLVTAAMIFLIGLLAMLRATKAKHAEDTQEKQSEKTQPGVGNKRTNENGTAPRRD